MAMSSSERIVHKVEFFNIAVIFLMMVTRFFFSHPNIYPHAKNFYMLDFLHYCYILQRLFKIIFTPLNVFDLV